MVLLEEETRVAHCYRFIADFDSFCYQRCQFDLSQICSYEDVLNLDILQPVLKYKGTDIGYSSEMDVDIERIYHEVDNIPIPQYLNFVEFMTSCIIADNHAQTHNEGFLKNIYLQQFTSYANRNSHVDETMFLEEIEEQLVYSNMLTELNCYTILMENGFSDEHLAHLMQQKMSPFSILSFAISFGFMSERFKENFRNKLFQILIDTSSIEPKQFSSEVDSFCKNILEQLMRVNDLASALKLDSSVIDENDITHNAQGRKYAKRLGSKSSRNSHVKRVRRKIDKICKKKRQNANESNIDLNLINGTISSQIAGIGLADIITGNLDVKITEANINDIGNISKIENISMQTAQEQNIISQNIIESIGKNSIGTNFAEVEEFRKILESEKAKAKAKTEEKGTDTTDI